MRRTLTALCLSLSIAAPALAEEAPQIVGYAGQFSTFRDSDSRSALFGGEYRFASSFNGLRPTAGAMVNADGGAYVYGGASWDLPIDTQPFVITPGLAVGGYHQGDSKDLGLALEFRSTLEVTYALDNVNRVGVSVSHLSNANLGSDNPGVETVQAVYSRAIW